jgi:hypothetical protein
MRETYVEAWTVLVFEHSLVAVDSKEMDDIEVVMRIICSPWKRAFGPSKKAS